VYNDTTNQKQIFDNIGFPLVQDVLNGKNGLLFTYGVTGSGKTYSMIGNQYEAGILQRSLDCIFSSIQGNQAKKFVRLLELNLNILKYLKKKIRTNLKRSSKRTK
jgi:kinesin family protein 23